MIAEKIRIILDEKKKDGFLDCIGDDKTRITSMQNANRTVRNITVRNEDRKNSNEEPNLE